MFKQENRTEERPEVDREGQLPVAEERREGESNTAQCPC
jgi:hypothetical protein